VKYVFAACFSINSQDIEKPTEVRDDGAGILLALTSLVSQRTRISSSSRRYREVPIAFLDCPALAKISAVYASQRRVVIHQGFHIHFRPGSSAFGIDVL
jgi:hypothetical protein